MTMARITGGGVLHFPPYGTIADSVSVIEPPPADTLPDIAAAVHPAELLLFSRRLVQAARKRHRNPRWQKVNRSRVVLARLCLDRALADWSAAMPAMPAHAGDGGCDEGDDLDEADRRDLVGEAFHTHGEDAARALAQKLGVAFEGCGEAIERLERRPS